jgi:hypothetical protein
MVLRFSVGTNRERNGNLASAIFCLFGKQGRLCTRGFNHPWRNAPSFASFQLFPQLLAR